VMCSAPCQAQRCMPQCANAQQLKPHMLSLASTNAPSSHQHVLAPSGFQLPSTFTFGTCLFQAIAHILSACNLVLDRSAHKQNKQTQLSCARSLQLRQRFVRAMWLFDNAACFVHSKLLRYATTDITNIQMPL
jgi:hypothetical protein